jgi:hypothetical protein
MCSLRAGAFRVPCRLEDAKDLPRWSPIFLILIVPKLTWTGLGTLRTELGTPLSVRGTLIGWCPPKSLELCSVPVIVGTQEGRVFSNGRHRPERLR